MANVRQYSNGRWQAVVRRKGYPLQSETFAGKAEAVQWARSVEAQIDSRRILDRSKVEKLTIAEGIDRYLPRSHPAQALGAQGNASPQATPEDNHGFIARHHGLDIIRREVVCLGTYNLPCLNPSDS